MGSDVRRVPHTRSVTWAGTRRRSSRPRCCSKPWVRTGKAMAYRAVRAAARRTRAVLSARCPDQSVDIGDDDAFALEPDQPVVGELTQELVHTLTGAPHHRREVALRQVATQPDPAVGEPRPTLVREPDEPSREAAGDIEEMQLLDVGRQ